MQRFSNHSTRHKYSRWVCEGCYNYWEPVITRWVCTISLKPFRHDWLYNFMTPAWHTHKLFASVILNLIFAWENFLSGRTNISRHLIVLSLAPLALWNTYWNHFMVGGYNVLFSCTNIITHFIPLVPSAKYITCDIHVDSWAHTIWGNCDTEDLHVVFWIMTQFWLVFGYQCFRVNSWFHLQGRKIEVIYSSQTWVPISHATCSHKAEDQNVVYYILVVGFQGTSDAQVICCVWHKLHFAMRHIKMYIQVE